MDSSYCMCYDNYMITTVTGRNMVSVPRAIAREYGIEPGCTFDWGGGDAPDELRVRVIPPRGVRARRLMGTGRDLYHEEDGVAGLVAERETEDPTD